MGSCCGAGAEAKAAAEKTGGAWAKAAALQKKLESAPALAVAGIALAASLVMSGHGCADHATRLWHGWRQLLDPAIVPLFICGLPILKEAAEALVLERRIRAALLISAAMVACVAIGQLFAAGEVAFIMALGEKLESLTVARAKKGLRKLASLVPMTARRVVTCPKCRAKGIFFKEVRVEEIAPGDGVEVKPGETIPVDGVVTEGATTVDESVMTGEPMPVDKAVGDEVYSGTINRYGAITVRATKAGEDGSIQKLVRLVKEAEGKKAPMQLTADRWAAILVPCSMAIAILTFFGVWVSLGDVGTALVRAVTILVVFCPCALALATPTSVMAAIGQAAKHGVVIKSGEALERMGAVTTVCLDKTGTLTEGRPSVSYSSGDAALSLAAAVEAKSEHPLAKAICAAAKDALECSGFEMKPGRGVKGDVEGRKVLCGTAVWMEENGVDIPQNLADEADRRRGFGEAVVFVAADGKAEGVIALEDAVRSSAKDAVEDLAACGVKLSLLTGDHEATARHVASSLGIGDVRPGLMPGEKAAAIEEMERRGNRCCMVGDGVNDAVALKTAYVGVAMGGAGSDIAVEAADIALVGDDLSRLGYLKRLSTACVRLIRFNIALSMCINAVAIACSMAGVLNPVSGALVHNCGSVLVVMNAALLYDRRFKDGRGHV